MIQACLIVDDDKLVRKGLISADALVTNTAWRS